MIDKVYLKELDSTRFEWIKLFFETRDGISYSNKDVMTLILDEFIKFNGIKFNPTKAQLKEAEVFYKAMNNAK